MQILRNTPWVKTAILLLVCIAAGKGLIELAVLLAPQARGFMGDAGTYLVMGRAILNGFTPYTELFESKPPGIFLLAALSIRIGGPMVLAMAQAGIYLLIPFILAAFAWRTEHSSRYIAAALAFLCGIMLSLFAEERTIGLQPESFGAFFGLLYVLSAAMQPGRRQTILCSLFLLLSIGMKEPFLLGNLAAALLLARDPKHFVQIFLLPLVIAAAVGTAVLVVLGYAGPYFSLYLPAMLQFRLYSNISDPLLLRGLAVHLPLGVLGRFSPLFGIAMIALWLVTPALKMGKNAPRLLNSYFLILTSSLFALYIASLAVGTGGYLPHHFLFGWPAYVALVVLFIRSLAKKTTMTLPIAVLIVIATLIHLPSAKHLRSLDDFRAAQTLRMTDKGRAATLDALMDRCGYERFHGALAEWTAHSPVGPLFSSANPRILGAEHSLFIESENNILATDMIVTYAGEPVMIGDKDLTSAVDAAFTTDPPACADPFLPIEGMDIRFRT